MPFPVFAKASGRSRTSLYYYYKNRDEIFHAVLESLARDIAAQISAAVGAVTEPRDKIYAFCIAKLKASQDWRQVLSTMWASLDTGGQMKNFKLMDALHKKLVHQESMILGRILETAAGLHGFRTLAANEQDMLAFIVSSSIRGLRRELYDFNDPHDVKTAVLLLTDIIVKWLKA